MKKSVVVQSAKTRTSTKKKYCYILLLMGNARRWERAGSNKKAKIILDFYIFYCWDEELFILLYMAVVKC